MIRVLSLMMVAGTAQAAQPIEAVLTAMEIDVASPWVAAYDLTPAAGNLAPDPQMFDVRESLGTWTPIGGLAPVSPGVPNTVALLSTGNVDNITLLSDHDYPGAGFDTSAGDAATVRLDLVPPPGMNSLSVYFNFCSREYPEWVGNIYNDTFSVDVDGPAWSGQAAFDSNGASIQVNSVLFDVVNSSDLVGTGFDLDGCTGWLRLWIPVASGQPVEVRFSVGDVGDGVWDSAVLLDDFDWSTQTPTAPFIQDGIDPETGLGTGQVDWPGDPNDPDEGPGRPDDDPQDSEPPGRGAGHIDLHGASSGAPPADDGSEADGDGGPDGDVGAGSEDDVALLVVERGCAVGGGGGVLLLPLLLVRRRRAR